MEKHIGFDLHSDDMLLYIYLPGSWGRFIMQIIDQKFDHKKIFFYPQQKNDLEKATLKQIRVIHGAIPFGPFHEIYQNIYQNPVILMFFRDPIELILTSFRHHKSSPNSPYHEEFSKCDITLLEFVQDPKYQNLVKNRQTNLLLKNYIRGKLKTLSDEAILFLVKERLEQSAFIGIAEKIKQSIQLMYYTFSWKISEDFEQALEIPIQKNLKNDISEDTLAAIRISVGFDLKLYEYAQDLFERRYTQLVNELLAQK